MVLVSSEQFDLRQIAESGQCFRMTEIEPGRYRVIALDKAVVLEERKSGILLDCSLPEYQGFWRDYFDRDTDYGEFLREIDESDPFLYAASEAGSGIRILRQDPWEMLVSFLISQRKSIPAIRTCIEALCSRFGEKIGGGKEPLYAFPTAERLAECTEDELAACSLGYRTRYVHEAAQKVASGELDLAAAVALDDEELYNTLLTLTGVGAKVADCVMLFGFHRLDRFPRDVWMNRVVNERYGGNFPFERYRGFLGVVQQYLFCYARENPELMK